MIFLTVDEIISLQSKLILKTGGIDGIREIEYTQQELIFLGLSIASSKATYDDVLMWLDTKIK